jgi:DNA polymerase-3 subunit gamma/tau
VIAFAGSTIAVDDVSTVLGLVGRDLLFDLIESVVEEDGPKAFTLADRAVEAGHDLKLVVRELSRVVRDMMILSVDPQRAGDGDLAEGERERLSQLAARFSREDLMRAFDLLAAAEQDIRNAAHPRYHFEMMLLKWMHLRKLVPLADLMEQLGAGAPRLSAPHSAKSPLAPAAKSPLAPAAKPPLAPAAKSPLAPAAKVPVAPPAKPPVAPAAKSPLAPGTKPPAAPTNEAASAPQARDANLKDALLAEIRSAKAFFYNMVVAQAQKIEVTDQRVAFSFLPTHRTLRDQFEAARSWLEPMAERLAGHKVAVVSVQAEAAGGAAPPAAAAEPAPPTEPGKRDLKSEAMASPAVQAVLDVFPAEIRDVEEIER